MANLSTIDKQILEKLFQMESGYVLNFSDRTMAEFFKDDLDIDIYSNKYDYASGSKANRMRAFWSIEENNLVGECVLKLINYIENQSLLGTLNINSFPENLMGRGRQIGDNLLKKTSSIVATKSIASFSDGDINISLQKEIFTHVEQLLEDGHFFTAVEEAYKIVRLKLKEVSGKERATDAFASSNYEAIFGKVASTEAEKDFYEGVKFLHMAIQFLRNEKAHTPASSLDKNLAIHYIALASLAYDMINKPQNISD